MATGGLLGQDLGQRRHFGGQVRRRHDAVDEPETMRLLRADLLAGQKELERPAGADKTRQPLRAAVAGDEPEVDLRLAELRRVGGDAQRARHRQLAAAAERVAVDRGDRGLAELLDEIEDLLAAERVLAPARRTLLGQLVDVGAGHERLLARAGDDHHADGVIGFEHLERLAQFVERPQAQGVEDARTIDRHPRDGIVALDEESLQRVGIWSAHTGAGANLKYTFESVAGRGRRQRSSTRRHRDERRRTKKNGVVRQTFRAKSPRSDRAGRRPFGRRVVWTTGAEAKHGAEIQCRASLRPRFSARPARSAARPVLRASSCRSVPPCRTRYLRPQPSRHDRTQQPARPPRRAPPREHRRRDRGHQANGQA